MKYTSTQNDKIKFLKKLQQKKYRDQTGLYLIEGEHLIIEAKKAGVLKEIYVLEGFEKDEENVVTLKVMQYITSLSSVPKIIGVCEKKEIAKGNKIVILDSIQDPGNLGTIIRSMIAFGADTLILSDDTVDVYSPKVLRATQGMIFFLSIKRCNLKEEIKMLKKENYFILGTKVDGGKNLKTIEKNEKFAIIMGNEGNGVHSDILDLADDYYYIPMSEKCESLNVGVALSIFLYELDK